MGDYLRDVDHEFEVAGSLGRSKEQEILHYGPFRVNSILTLENLKFIKLKYQIPADFRLEVANLIKAE